MRVAFLVLALALPAASSALPAAPPPGAAVQHRLAKSAIPSRICGDSIRPRDISSPEAAKPKRLGDLPPADLTLAVVNQVGDCIEPVTVRQGVGDFGGR